jgi:polar amino acid transport system substrate-binding protein
MVNLSTKSFLPVALALLFSFSVAHGEAPAQAPSASAPPRQGPPASEIAIATRVIEPFILEEGDQLSGFSADLWRAIAAELGLKSRFVVYRLLPQLLDAVEKGEAAAGIAAISITAEREQHFEFSQPMFRSGLAIMVRDDGQSLNVMSVLFSLSMLKAVGLFLLVLIIPAHLIWLLARGRDEGLPIAETYIPGICDAIFWCAESMGGAAQAHPTRNKALAQRKSHPSVAA